MTNSFAKRSNFKEKVMSKQQKQMTRWANEKLEKELAFADGSEGDDPNAALWLANIKAEISRRERHA